MASIERNGGIMILGSIWRRLVYFDCNSVFCLSFASRLLQYRFPFHTNTLSIKIFVQFNLKTKLLSIRPFTNIMSPMWYLNYCSPFVYNSVGPYQVIRYILYSCILIELLIYIFYIAKYKWSGQEIQLKNKLDQNHDVEDEGLHIVRKSISYQGVGDKQYRMDQKKFKEWYLHYFGMHSIAVAGCIMYSPYYPQVVFTILHTILFPIASFMHSCTLQKTSRIIFNVILSLVVVLDILLLFSLSMGVGSSGYDTNTKNCYLLQ